MPKQDAYPAAASLKDGDIFTILQDGKTRKITGAALKAAGGFAPHVRHNLSGSGAPGAGDDAGDGYAVGSRWVDATASPLEIYECVDASAGAAVWLKTTFTLDELGTGALRGIEAATAENDLLFGGPSPFGWVRKTLAQAKAILGIGSADMPSPEAENDFLCASGSPLGWVKKTLAEAKTILGVGAGGGSVLVQVRHAVVTAVVSGSTQMVDDDTIPQSNEGFEVITCAITPKSAGNNLLIIANVNMGYTMAGNGKYVALFKDAQADALASSGVYNYYGDAVSLVHQMTAGGTSEVTFRVRAGCINSGTVYINSRLGNTGRAHGGVFATTLTVLEYANPA